MTNGFSYELDDPKSPRRIAKIRGHRLPVGLLHVDLDVASETRSLDQDAVECVRAIFSWADSVRDDLKSDRE